MLRLWCAVPPTTPPQSSSAPPFQHGHLSAPLNQSAVLGAVMKPDEVHLPETPHTARPNRAQARLACSLRIVRVSPTTHHARSGQDWFVTAEGAVLPLGCAFPHHAEKTTTTRRDSCGASGEGAACPAACSWSRRRRDGASFAGDRGGVGGAGRCVGAAEAALTRPLPHRRNRPPRRPPQHGSPGGGAVDPPAICWRCRGVSRPETRSFRPRACRAPHCRRLSP